MKKILLIFALAAFVTGGFAQVENEKTETVVTKTTTSDSQGKAVKTKEVTKTEIQDKALTDFDGKHNFNTVMLPTEVNTDVDYDYDGVSYRFRPVKPGYAIIDLNRDDTEYARIYPSTQDGYYIYIKDGRSSLGYFNEDGDFVVEAYDPDNDGVMNYRYKIDLDDPNMKKKLDKMKKKNK
jgi:hypothetical protein